MRILTAHAIHVATPCYVMHERARKIRNLSPWRVGLCLDFTRLDSRWPPIFFDRYFKYITSNISIPHIFFFLNYFLKITLRNGIDLIPTRSFQRICLKLKNYLFFCARFFDLSPWKEISFKNYLVVNEKIPFAFLKGFKPSKLQLN